jgi:hypothetical protein
MKINKTTWITLSLLIVGSMVLAACGAPAPEPAEPETVTVVETVEVEVVKEVEITPTPLPEPQYSLDDLGVTALDDYTVQFTLERKAGYFPAIAGMWVARPMPQWTIDEWGQQWTEAGLITTNGPMVLESCPLFLSKTISFSISLSLLSRNLTFSDFPMAPSSMDFTV